MFRRRLNDVVSAPLVVAAALVFLFEEVLWAWVGRLMEAIGRWAPVARLEAAIQLLPPYLAMTLFVLPWAIIVPVKLLALWLLATGQVFLGIALFAAGELLGVGILARIYVLCRPSLRQLAWFVRLEAWVQAASAWAHRRLDDLVLWQRTRAMARGLALRLRSALDRSNAGWLGRRIRAALRLAKMQIER